MTSFLTDIAIGLAAFPAGMLTGRLLRMIFQTWLDRRG